MGRELSVIIVITCVWRGWDTSRSWKSSYGRKRFFFVNRPSMRNLYSDQLQSFTFEISIFSAELRTPIFTSAMPHCSTSLYYHQLHGVTFKCSDFSAELRTLIFTCAVPHCTTSLYYYQFHGVIFESFVLSAELKTLIFTSAMPHCSVWM